MKKILFILAVLVMFCSGAFAVELVNIEETVFPRYEKVFAKDLQNTPDIKGNVEVYLDLSESGRLNFHKILGADNEQLAEMFDEFLKSIEKPAPKFYKSYKYVVVLSKDSKVNIDVKSKNNHYRLREKNYYEKLNMKVNEDLPTDDYIDLAMTSAELTLSSRGEVKSVKIIESSGDKLYDETLSEYLSSKSYGVPPADILKNEEVSFIIYVNPSSPAALEEYYRYYRRVSSEIEKQIRVYNYISYPIYFQFDKQGNVSDVKMFRRYDEINPEAIIEELKRIKVSPYEGEIIGDNIEVVYLGGKSLRGLQNYYEKKMYPEILKSIPEVTSLKLKPIKLLLLMTKDGYVEEVDLVQSSGSEEFDNKTVEAVKGNWYEAFENRSTDKFIFEIELYNLNKFLRQHYSKYTRTVAATAMANIPTGSVKTDKIYFVIKRDGKIKEYQLYDNYNNVITEKRVDDRIKRLTFPRIPRAIDTDELSVLIDLHSPKKQYFSKSTLNTMTLGTAIMYKQAR